MTYTEEELDILVIAAIIYGFDQARHAIRLGDDTDQLRNNLIDYCDKTVSDFKAQVHLHLVEAEGRPN